MVPADRCDHVSTRGTVRVPKALYIASSRFHHCQLHCQVLASVVKTLALRVAVSWGRGRVDRGSVKGEAPRIISLSHEPRRFSVRVPDRLSPAAYRHLRFRYFKLHFCYFLTTERPGLFDFYRLTLGPKRATEQLEAWRERAED